jgi:hypothetical protein
MSEKLKALINSVFIQLNRYEKQQPDFSPEVFLRECESYFAELDRLDVSGDGGVTVDEHLKLRVNTVPHQAQPLTLVTANLLPLYFWYMRRPPQQQQNAFLAAKKLRSSADDSLFVEQTVAPLVFGPKIKSLGKHENAIRSMLLNRFAQIALNFRESDQLSASTSQVFRTDSWQKKMLHISARAQQGRKAEIRSFAPEEELRLMCSQSDFAAWYLSTNEIYKGQSRFLLAIKRFFGAIGSAIMSIFNLRFVFHVFRDRWPVYIVYLVLTLLFFYASVSVRPFWEKQHRSKVQELKTTNNFSEVYK